MLSNLRRGMDTMYKYKNYLEAYGRIMQFNKNKSEPLHRWYPFVEGYSKEFIQSIINELKTTPNVCLEPFSGSGTTALELQSLGIKCFSFEVNPLMYLVAKVKLECDYQIADIIKTYEFIVKERNNEITHVHSNFKTLYEQDGLSKWNYNTEVAVAVEKLMVAINKINIDIYKNLFTIALASILLDISNLYRNGKCLSYKKKWEDKIITEEDVFRKFDDKVNKELIVDIQLKNRMINVQNKEYLFHEDSRVGIDKRVEDNSIDLVITSPPYLNSRDYTDTYMLELKTLGFTKTNDEVRELREKTLRSHVQIKWKDIANIDSKMLRQTIKKLENATKIKKMWNDSIIDMVRLYFVDMECIFSVLYKKVKDGGKIYFNVSNSAYYGVLINTLEICASIAENNGFKVIEIRKARYLKTSPQQKEEIDKLLEGVIVLEK